MCRRLLNIMRGRHNSKSFRRNLNRFFTGVLFLFGLRILWALSLRHHREYPLLAMKQPEGYPIFLYTVDVNNSDFTNTRQDNEISIGVKTYGKRTMVYVTDFLNKSNEKLYHSANDLNNVSSDTQKTILDYVYDGNKADQSQTNDPGAIPERVDSPVTSFNAGIDKLYEEAKTDVCQVVRTWGKKYHAQVFSYDILSTLVYHTDAKGEYPIPTRTFTEIEQSNKRTNKPKPPVEVILVPFSHADPGYGLTLEQYYKSKTQKTLDLMITKLDQYRNMTFQWAETVFLARWFDDLRADGKAKVKELIDRGQLEIVSGGWVMPDESQTTITSVVDQLIEGHQWLQEHLQVSPKSAWVNDPFGYSSTFPYLWKSAGMDNMMFLRVNQPLKAKLMEMQSLDFRWRPFWLNHSNTDILATLMPYTNYWINDVCGPNPKICSKFNYLHLGERRRNAVSVTDDNVKDLATELYQQLTITADLYKYGVLYVGLGEDFSYTKASEWGNMYTNFNKLMNYINNRTDWNMKIKFGTVTEYFTKLREREKQTVELEKKVHKQYNLGHFPTFSGDFFPYTDRKCEFWTGYFTTRPLNKRFAREIESLLHAADQYNVLVHAIFKYYGVTYKARGIIAGELRAARRELAIFMHHDGITGTSVPHVVRDFEKRLVKSYTHTQVAMKTILASLLTRGKLHEPTILQEEYFNQGNRKISEKRVFDTSKEVKVVVINPTPYKRKEVVNLHVTSELFSIESPLVKDIKAQVQNTFVLEGNTYKTAMFEIELPAFGIEMLTLTPKAKPQETPSQSESTPNQSADSFILENMHMKVEFWKETGLLKRVTDSNGRVTDIITEFHSFYTTKGGAYIMDGDSREVPFPTNQRYVTMTHGPIMSEVKVSSIGFVYKVRIYNTTAISGYGIHMSLELNMHALGMTNKDVVMLIRTNIESGPGFYTDQNNFNMIGRKTRKIISEAYYPISGLLIIEDSFKRLNIHSRQPHGVSSLDGAIEIMLDRHTFRDDGRGLGQGVYDNVRVNSDFIFHIEHKHKPFQPVESRYTFPTEDCVIMNEFLQNPMIMYAQINDVTKLVTKVHPMKSVQFPCDIRIVKLRDLHKEDLSYNSTSLVLHRRSLHCGFTKKNDQCAQSTHTMTIKDILPKLKVKISEMSLSMLLVKRELTYSDDIKPNRDELRTFKIEI